MTAVPTSVTVLLVIIGIFALELVSFGRRIDGILFGGKMTQAMCFCKGCRAPRGYSSSRDLVWTFIKGKDRWYDTNLLSARSSGCRARIALTTDTEHKFPPHFGRIIQLTETEVFYQEVGEYLHPDKLRLTWLRSFLIDHESEFDRVFCMDAFDVFLDGDPFQIFQQKDSEEMVFVEECQTLGGEWHNAKWVKSCFGRSVLRIVGNKAVLNSGTTFGGTHIFIRYLDVIINMADWNTCCCDQPRIAWLVYGGILSNHSIPFRILRAGGQVIPLTVCPRKVMDVEGATRIVQPDGSVPLVVHQWIQSRFISNIIYQRCYREDLWQS